MRNLFAPVFDSQEDAEIAWKAVKEAEKHLPQWEAFLRMVGRNPKLKLRLTGGQPRTDGHTVYVQVPMALGRISEHNRKACGARDKHGLQACEACRALEAVLLTILHESAHIVFGTFAKVSDAARAQAVQDGIRLEARGQAETTRAGKIAKAIELAPDVFKQDFMNLAGLVSPYLPIIVNCIEDTRVNVAMTSARKGIRLMFEAWIMRYFREGTEGIDGKTYFWHDAPVNMQAIISIYCETSELTNYRAYLDPEVAAKLDNPEFLMLCERAKKIRHVSESYTLGVQLLECLRRMGFCLAPEDLMDEPEPEPESSDDPSDKDEEEQDEEPQPGDSEEPEDGDTGDDPNGQDTGQDSTDTGADASDGDAPEDDPNGADSGGKEPENDDQEGEAGDDDTGGAGSDDPAQDGDGSDESEHTGDGADESDEASGEPEATPDDQGDPGSEGEGDEGEDAGGDSSDQGGGSGDPAEGGDQDDAGDGDDSSGSDGASDGSDAGSGDAPSGRDDDGGSEPAAADGSSDGGSGSAGDADASQGGGTQPEAGDGSGGGVTSGDYVASPEPITQEKMEEMGTPEKVAELFAIFGGHAKPEDFDDSKEDGEGGDDEGPVTAVVENDNTEEEAEQIEVAIAQAQHFDKVSNDLEGLNVWHWPKDKGVYAFGSGDGYSRRSVPVEKPPATLLAGSLQKLRILFTENRRGAKVANLRKGKVDPKKLSRFATGDDRLFRKKSQPGKKDYFVCIGFDCSGSTGIGPLGYIKSSVAAMAEMMTRLGIKFSVQAHSGSGNHVEIFEIKGPDQPWNDKTYEALSAIKAFHCNLDGHSLEYYRKQCQARKETDKVLFFYTDGALNNIGEEYDVFTENVEILRQLGITTVGVEVNGDYGLSEVLGMDTVKIDGPEDTRKVVDKLEECLGQRVYA